MISWFFIGLVITILFTPGPTNTLLASSGVQVGVRKSLLLIPAEALGYIVAITAWGMLIGKVSTALPLLPTFLKLMSAGYILYLAIKLWRTANQQVALNQPTIRPRELLFATLLNPKALLFASAIFPHAAWEVLHVYFVHIAIFLSLITPIAFLWIAFGTVLISNRVTWLNQRNLQRTAAFILTFFAMPIGYSAISSF